MTFPGEFFFKPRGCDAIIFNPDINQKDIYYTSEIKSCDENPISWLSHPSKEDQNNPELFKVREYWINESKSQKKTKEVFGWAFAITGQLEQYFDKGYSLLIKSHINDPRTNNVINIPKLPNVKKRMVIFDDSHHSSVKDSLNIIGLDNLYDLKPEIPACTQYSWLKYWILVFERPEESSVIWYGK